jgi:hypothetical protein
MPVPNKEAIRSSIYARLLTLLNSTDEEVSLKAAKELGTIAGIYAEVTPKSLSASQTNNFVLSPDQLSGVLDGLKKISSGPGSPKNLPEATADLGNGEGETYAG